MGTLQIGSMNVSISEIVLIAIAVLIVVVAIVAWVVISRQRSRRLRSKFGPEYDYTVGELHSRGKAERDLEHREERVEQLTIRPLPAAARERYLQTWREVQNRFVDDPKGAVMVADHLVDEVMIQRGYPEANFERRVQDISVHHPHLAQNYRAARVIALRERRGEGATEDLRRALVNYRALFDELLGETQEVSR